MTLRGQNNYTWAANTSLPAALETSTGTPADRLAATWYAANSFEIDVRINDGQTHQIALYALDWNDGTRSQTIQLFDTVSGVQLDSRSITNFSNGVYLVWNVSGRVTIKVTRNTGPTPCSVDSSSILRPPQHRLLRENRHHDPRRLEKPVR